MSEELTKLEELELRRLRDRQASGIPWQSQPQISGHQTVAMNAVGVGPEIPDLRRPLLQSQKCLHGEHESEPSFTVHTYVVELRQAFKDNPVRLCKYCRCLYVEKT